ncbi:MAG: arsenite methyltransferase [Planctomycetes bacterium]|nr:arsenite methyltransferase [Planctomycetota bacterium]
MNLDKPKTPSDSNACCSPSSGCCDETPNPQADAVHDRVRAGYAEIARSGSWGAAKEAASSGCCGPSSSSGGGCCGPTTLTPEQLTAAIGYSAHDLVATPDAANMGLSCGNPTALAALVPGETVLDLGAGGGLDCFVAGPRVGANGRVIGVDMTPEMVSKARKNLAMYRAQSGLDNVEFRLGEIEHLPVANERVDVVLSNCVLNLSPDKPRVWREIARVLRPGGRVAVSDIALLRPLPEAIAADLEALVGCVAGAALVADIDASIRAAGLVDVVLTKKSAYIDAMTNADDPLYAKIVAHLPSGTKPSDFITSLDISARKPN